MRHAETEGLWLLAESDFCSSILRRSQLTIFLLTFSAITSPREFAMAELVGLASAGVGIAAFALQLAGTIKTLKEICSSKPFEASRDLQSLSMKLEILHEVVLSLSPWEGCRPVDATTNLIHSRYKDIESARRACRKTWRVECGPPTALEANQVRSLFSRETDREASTGYQRHHRQLDLVSIVGYRWCSALTRYYYRCAASSRTHRTRVH